METLKRMGVRHYDVYKPGNRLACTDCDIAHH